MGAAACYLVRVRVRLRVRVKVRVRVRVWVRVWAPQPVAAHTCPARCAACHGCHPRDAARAPPYGCRILDTYSVAAWMRLVAAACTPKVAACTPMVAAWTPMVAACTRTAAGTRLGGASEAQGKQLIEPLPTPTLTRTRTPTPTLSLALTLALALTLTLTRHRLGGAGQAAHRAATRAHRAPGGRDHPDDGCARLQLRR